MKNDHANNSDVLNILSKVYWWDLILFIPGALLFYYLPLENLLNMVVNIIIFFFFTAGIVFTKISLTEQFKKKQKNRM